LGVPITILMAFVGLKIQVMGPGGKPAWLKNQAGSG